MKMISALNQQSSAASLAPLPASRLASLAAILDRAKPYGLTVARLVIGLVFAMHGGQKFFQTGIGNVAQMFGGMGIPFPLLSATLAASAEFFGGLFLILGFLTRLAAIPMAFTMIVAFATVHGKNGFFLQQGGFEYVFTLFGVLVAFMLTGPGALSVDGLIAAWVKRRNS